MCIYIYIHMYMYTLSGINKNIYIYIHGSALGLGHSAYRIWSLRFILGALLGVDYPLANVDAY